MSYVGTEGKTRFATLKDRARMLQGFGIGAGREGKEAGRSPSVLPFGFPPRLRSPRGACIGRTRQWGRYSSGRSHPPSPEDLRKQELGALKRTHQDGAEDGRSLGLTRSDISSLALSAEFDE
jgi:hypothetical protein